MTRARLPPIGAIFLTLTVDLTGFGLLIPFLPLYAKSFGASGSMVALLFASYAGTQFLTAPILGRLSDRFGRRPLLLVSIAANALALAVFGFAESFWWLLIARLIAGALTSNVSVASAAFADLTSPEERARGMGLVGAAFGIGFVIGPFAGGVLSTAGYDVASFAAAGLAVLNLVSAYFILPETLPAEERTAAPHVGWIDRVRIMGVEQVTTLIAVVFVNIIAFSMLEMAFVLYVNVRLDFDSRQAGYAFAYIGVLLAVVQGGLIGRLSKRFGEGRLLLVGLGLVAVGIGSLASLPQGQWLLLIPMITAIAVGRGLAQPSLMSLISRRTSTANQGIVMGLAQAAGSLGRTFGPQGAGTLYDLHPELPFLAGAGLTLVAFSLAAVALKTPRTALEPSQTL